MKSSLSLALLPLFLLTQCATDIGTSAQQTTSKPIYDTKLDTSGSFRKNGYWVGDGMSGKARIRINLTEQVAFFYKGSQLAGISPISSGQAGYDTPTGTFRISQKNRKHNS